MLPTSQIDGKTPATTRPCLAEIFGFENGTVGAIVARNEGNIVVPSS
jgi:hypothetical protein